MKMFSARIIVSAMFLGGIIAHAETNQFVMALNAAWASKSASNVLGFIEKELTDRPNDPQVLFARAVAAVELEQWCRGATNYCARAIEMVRQDSYTAENKQFLLKELSEHLEFFTASIGVFKEPEYSFPQTNAILQAEMFQSCPSEFPYADFIARFNSP